MRTYPLTIVGAGLAGLLAAHAWPQARIVERSPAPTETHKALLRFRSDAVARLTGFEFRKVTVRKAIWFNWNEVAPSPRFANWYSQKCLGFVGSDRSIWNLDPVERFIAPETFYSDMVASLGSRIEWGTDALSAAANDVMISTAPLSDTIKYLEPLHGVPPVEFRRAPIWTIRYRLPVDTDVYQTVYFPEPDLTMYRASITGSMLIMEFVGEFRPSVRALGDATVQVLRAFGFPMNTELIALDALAKQQFGKIAPMADDAARKQILFRLSHEHRIYSLGRFATWRNILLDDVVNDIDVIKRLLKAGAYESRAQLS